MKVAGFSEALVTIYRAALRPIPERRNLDNAVGTSNPVPRCMIFPENPVIAQWLMTFAAFSECGRFITVLTTDPTMSQLHSVCNLTQYFPSINFNVTLPIHFFLDLLSDLSISLFFSNYTVSLRISCLSPLRKVK